MVSEFPPKSGSLEFISGRRHAKPRPIDIKGGDDFARPAPGDDRRPGLPFVNETKDSEPLIWAMAIAGGASGLIVVGFFFALGQFAAAWAVSALFGTYALGGA